ncbi:MULTISPECIES: M1 family metallopeptidase [Sphingobacterium]|uniref:Peptidase M1 n=1 Tax=Sphingobacterium cellulitidis TaxID=1768011 RepID=A0A8H9G2Z1_9SPHI|nr:MULTISPECIES: M1 family metallopeptidase [Sphingobacterium]MBA8988565.1 aminopeptidase N [Sphingobacterium soli]WFB62586.1 M1 family metallopeptidase [Sphingobacterium sp. WM]GGE33821.1 peptidase M1 [Sphingobacterium soli]
MLKVKSFFLGLLLCSASQVTQAQLMKAKEIYNKADSLRGELTPLRTCYDVQYYHLDVKVDIDQKFISGSNLFKFQAVERFNKLQFDLFDNLSVDKVEYRGKDLPFSREYNAVFVEFPDFIEKGKIDSFKVYYSGHPIQATRAPWDGGFDWKKDSNGKPWVATACQGLGASVWWPNKDHQSDEANSMLISIAVPKGVMNVSNGRLVKTESLKDGYTKYHWRVENPINNYNVALNIGDYTHFKETYAGEKGPLSLDYYVLKENASKIDHLKKNANETLKAFEHWFGPYPFYEDGYKLVETAHLGMEHQSAVAYGNKYQNGYLGNDGSRTGWGMKWDFIVVHESGHEWFGNNITAKDLGDMWIHESFTNYSEALFIDFFYGKEASQAYVNGNRRGIQNDLPIQGPYNVNKEGSGDMYNKGGVLHNMIRTMIDNDETWLRLLRGINKEFYHKTVDYNDILNYMSKESGINLAKTFEQYVQRTSIPTLEVIQNSPGVFMVRWISEVKGFDMPVHIFDKDGKRMLIKPTENFKIMRLEGLTKENFKVDTFNYYIGTSIQ